MCYSYWGWRRSATQPYLLNLLQQLHGIMLVFPLLHFLPLAKWCTQKQQTTNILIPSHPSPAFSPAAFAFCNGRYKKVSVESCPLELLRRTGGKLPQHLGYRRRNLKKKMRSGSSQMGNAAPNAPQSSVFPATGAKPIINQLGISRALEMQSGGADLRQAQPLDLEDLTI